MRDDVNELHARIREAQEVTITNGPLVAVMEGRMHVTDVMKEAARKPNSGVTGERPLGEAARDVSSYDPVLRWHSRT